MISRFCCIFKRKCGKIGKKTTSFDFILSTAVEGSLLRGGRPFQGERREVQTPPLCEYRLAVEFSLAINFIIAPVYSSVARLRISLSSGISMFARER